jgi:HK97 family phage major capsid protein
VKTPGSQITGVLMEHPKQKRFDVSLGRKAAGAPLLVGPPSSAVTVQQVTPGPVLPIRMRSIIPGGSMVGDGIIYARETSITNSVFVPVAHGALKAEGGLTYEVVTRKAVTIPAYMKLPSQYWEDFAMLQSWIDSRLLYSLSLAEEKQLLNGTGVAPNLEGLMLVAQVVATVAGTGGVALIDNVMAGISKLFSFGYIPDGVVVNPTDWGNALTVKAGGGYLLGPPALITNPLNLWGIPVVLSPAMASGSYLVGQFDPYCQIFDRDDAALEVADQNVDDFVKNLVTVRAEERLAFAIYQPGAFAKGTFTP